MLKFKWLFILGSCWHYTSFLTAGYQLLLSKAKKEPTLSLIVNTHYFVGGRKGSCPRQQ